MDPRCVELILTCLVEVVLILPSIMN